MITHLAVKNYRSLKDMELPLGLLNVLIGANGSGKSNILDVLRLVRDVGANGQAVSDAVSERGWIRRVGLGGVKAREKSTSS